MTKGYFTQQELVNLKILTDSMKLESNRIKDLLNTHLTSDAYKNAETGINYYEGKHDILTFLPKYYNENEELVTDTTKTNFRLQHLFHKVLVDQKAAYIVGNPIVIASAEQDNSDTTKETEKQDELLMSLLGDSFDDIMNDWVIAASNAGSGWVHFYIDSNQDLQFIVCNSLELTPIYDTKYQKKLVGMMRSYMVEEVLETGNKLVPQYRYRIEFWTEKDVTYYVETEQGCVLDPEHKRNPAGHWNSFNTMAPDIKIPKSWGRVPFIELPNNSNKKTDLEPIKSLIDACDKVKSGWINDLVDFQELVYLVKGFNGLTGETKQGLSELAIFLKNLKIHKVISVDEDGAVNTLKAEIPVEAKEKFLTLTRKEIFYFGQGVDIDSDKFGNSPSGISLKFLYGSLDMKANILIRKMKKALTNFMYFIAKYSEITGKGTIDPNGLVYTFNKAVIFNEKEKVDMLVASEGMISKQTTLENHPLVEDAIEEQARIDLEKEQDIQSGVVDLSKINNNQNMQNPTPDNMTENNV